jgi:leucyl-tRNA synthetase
VQVNGKLRGSLKLPKSADKKSIEGSATGAMEKYIAGQAVKKIIIVPGRLINIVV